MLRQTLLLLLVHAAWCRVDFCRAGLAPALFDNASTVQRVSWESFGFAVEGGPTSKREPFVVTGSPAAKWPKTVSEWAGLTVLPKLYSNSKSALFILANGTQHVHEMPALETSELHENATLQTVLQPSANSLHYAAAPLAQLHPDVSAALSPREFMEAEEVGDQGNASLSAAVLWATQEGAVAHLHYDKAHNMFTVLTGNKTFLLLPPSAWSRLPLFPSFHPLARHARRDVLGVLGTAATTTAIPGALRADLGPGDVLYVPPFWFHGVISQTTSISLSVLSPSVEEQIAAAVRWTKLPLSNMTTVALKAAAAHVLLSGMLQKGAVQQIWDSRHDRGWPDTGLVPLKCFEDRGEWEAAHRSVEGQSSMAEAGKQLREKLELLEHGTHATDVREVVAADFAENLCAWAVGLSNVAHFLQRCFRV